MISYEAYALVRDLVSARPLAPITMKGISREVIPYAVEGLRGEAGGQVISEHASGLDIFLDTGAITDDAADRAKRVLREAISALDARRGPGPDGPKSGGAGTLR